MSLRKYIRFAIDFVKREFEDFSKKRTAQLKPIETAIDSLKRRGLMRDPIHALDLFGMYGLWLTRDYAHYCDKIEFWELDRDFFNCAKISLRGLPVEFKNGDSIAALKNRKLSADSYNLIVMDNPAREYGPYCEHFDIIDNIWSYVAAEGTTIIFNVCHDPEAYSRRLGRTDNTAWLNRRKDFYAFDLSSVLPNERIQALKDFYCSKVPVDLDVKTIEFFSRAEGMGMMVLCVANKI